MENRITYSTNTFKFDIWWEIEDKSTSKMLFQNLKKIAIAIGDTITNPTLISRNYAEWLFHFGYVKAAGHIFYISNLLNIIIENNYNNIFYVPDTNDIALVNSYIDYYIGKNLKWKKFN